MRWMDGSVYIGEWARGIQHGYGKMIFIDGSVKEGYFDNNVYVGHIQSKSMMQNSQEKSKRLDNN